MTSQTDPDGKRCWRCGKAATLVREVVGETVELPDHTQDRKKDEPQRYIKIPLRKYTCEQCGEHDFAPHMSINHTCHGCRIWRSALDLV